MSENYIVINGKRTELTEEQLRQLGIEVPKTNPFARVEQYEPFYFINNRGGVEYGVETQDYRCENLHKVANYCADRAIMEQRALHELLSRLLWRYSMEHNGNENKATKYFVYYSPQVGKWKYDYWAPSTCAVNDIWFDTEEIARKAIVEIIEPFMEAHPEFKW